MSEHEHYWRHATVLDGRGARVAGRRCDCGIETIGGINAPVIRASQNFNDAMVAGLVALGKSLERARKTQRYER